MILSAGPVVAEAAVALVLVVPLVAATAAARARPVGVMVRPRTCARAPRRLVRRMPFGRLAMI
jgi:hypothetical protein